MTDVFFPESPPSSQELKLIQISRYTPIPPKDGEFTVEHLSSKTNKSFDDPIVLPEHYYTHVRHFLWRHQLLMQIEGNAKDIPLPNGMLSLVRRYIWYMDAMIESLLMPAHLDRRPNLRSDTFDLYLVTEHQVGRHECDIADQWRLSHPDIILEGIDVTSLDWQAFYESQDNLHPVWSGAKYDFKITNVPNEVGAYQELAGVAAAFFGLAAPDMGGRKPRAAKGKKRASPSGDIPESSGGRRKRKVTGRSH